MGGGGGNSDSAERQKRAEQNTLAVEQLWGNPTQATPNYFLPSSLPSMLTFDPYATRSTAYTPTSYGGPNISISGVQRTQSPVVSNPYASSSGTQKIFK